MNDERNWDGGQDDSGHQPPRYEHYQFHEEHKETLITPGPSEHKKNQNSFQKKVAGCYFRSGGICRISGAEFHSG